MVGRHLSSELLLLTGPGAQCDHALWGPLPNNRSATSDATSNYFTCWDQLIIDQEDSEAWPSKTYRQSTALQEGCALDTDSGHWTSDTSSICSKASMATGANSQAGHFSTNHLSSKTNSGPSPGTSMLSTQGAANRSWGSGPSHCPPQSSVVAEGKSDSPVTSSRGWGASSSTTTNFNLNLNPNANPSAWPVLGHDAAGSGTGSSGGARSASPPQPPPSLCNPAGPSTQTSTCTGANTVSHSAGGSSAWGGSSEPKTTPSTNVSFSSEPQNLKTDGPNLSKLEPPSPIHSVSGWGNAGGHQDSTQVNGEDASSKWIKSGDSNAPSSKDGWDSGWGHGGSAAGASGGWGEQSRGDWGKPNSDEPQGGWDAPTSPPQDQQSSPWGRPLSTAAASEGSSDSMEGHPRRRDPSSRDDPPPLVPSQDLDPRVLCNTGWGQTPVRQHTSWDMEDAKRKNMGPDSWGTGPAASNEPQGHPTNMAPAQRPDSGSRSEAPAPHAAPGWSGSAPTTNQSSPGWGDGANSNKTPVGASGWGSPTTGGQNTNMPKNGAPSWVEEKSTSWESHAKPTPQGWSDQPKPSHGWANSGRSNNTGDWGESSESKKSPTNAAWDGEPGGWKENPRGWGSSASGSGNSAAGGNGNWGEAACQRPNGPAQGWGGKSHDGPSGGGAVGSWGGSGPGPGPLKPAGGWTGGKQEHTQPTGWEEPSPPSIRRKMEIDDGTSAWGDPGSHNKSVNLWDRNNPGMSQAKTKTMGSNTPGPNTNHSQPHSVPYHGPPPPLQSHCQNPQNTMEPAAPQPGLPHSRGPPLAQGWGELERPSSHAKSESSWGEHAPSPVSVDNGTSSWGKPVCGGWGDNSPEYGRGNPNMTSASCKTAPKPMQDSWGGGGEELGLSGGQWDTEDGDMWNSAASQESNSSCNSWGNVPKKAPPKVKAPGKQEDTWIMNRLIKQLTDMGFPRDPAEEALKSNNLNLDQAMSALLEKKIELDKRGMGMTGHDYNNGLLNKPMNCPRPQLLSKDPMADPRLPFMDKMQSGMFGGGSAQARAMQPPLQPPVPPLSSSQPNLRAQVPPFLSPQVQAQLLQFAAKNIGLNPALLTSPINPQHMTLLNQLYQLQLAYQRLQIQQQMLQAQRNVSGPIRQQEQQVARTINNMQQQIQQHQRQLAQALLMKQQQQPPPAHSVMHPGGNKSSLDSFPGHPQAPGLSDLQTKDPQLSANTYSPYSLSGLNSNMNVNCLEVGGLSMKESPQPQSRLSQWTHANSIDSISETSSPLETSLGKHGANLGGLGKSPQMEDSFSPYNLMSNSESPTSPMVPPDNWGQSKGSSDKMANGTNINWPPEFCPGVPWKGLQNIDPETDPNMTPGSVPSGPTINTNIQDVNRYLLRDRSGGSSPTSSQTLPSSTDWPVNACTSSFSLSSPDTDDAGKLSEMKSTWSPGPIAHSQVSLSHELWKVPAGPRSSSTAPSRPPPGLTNNKSSSTWTGTTMGLPQGWSSSASTAGTTWSTDSSSRTSSWLVLRNLTPQIDGSTLRTLCMQHGPLITFHLNLTQGNAVVRYNSKEEAAKAQKSLHMCVLGNTTILAEFAGEEEVNRFFAQGQSLGGTSSWQATPGTNQTRMGGTGSGVTHPIGHSPHWNNNNSSGAGNGGAKTGGELLWGGVQQYSSLWGPPSGEEGRVMGSPTQINTLLPGDLLSGESI